MVIPVLDGLELALVFVPPPIPDIPEEFELLEFAEFAMVTLAWLFPILCPEI